MKITQNEHLTMLQFPIGSYACNCSILFINSSKEAIIVDPGNDFAALKKIIDQYQLKPKILLHTHAHFDHIGESNLVKNCYHAKMHLHKDDHFLYQLLKEQGRFFGQQVGELSPIDHFIEDGEEYDLSDEFKNVIQSLHTPGHTPGSTSFYLNCFDAPMLLSGDTLFYRSIGRTDLPGGDGKQIVKSIRERLFTLPEETLVIPGHGPQTRVYEEKKLNPFLC